MVLCTCHWLSSPKATCARGRSNVCMLEGGIEEERGNRERERLKTQDVSAQH